MFCDYKNKNIGFYFFPFEWKRIFKKFQFHPFQTLLLCRKKNKTLKYLGLTLKILLHNGMFVCLTQVDHFYNIKSFFRSEVTTMI